MRTKYVFVQLAVRVPAHLEDGEAMTVALGRIRATPQHLAIADVVMTEACHVTTVEGPPIDWGDHDKAHEAFEGLKNP